MRDLRNEMYASSMKLDDDSYAGGTVQNDMRYVTKSEFDRVVKMFERKIAMLEAKITNNGWESK